MANDEKEQGGPNIIDGNQMEIKIEPAVQYYVEEEHENSLSSIEGNGTIPSTTVDVGALNLWTSKATTCLISQYKKYRSMVGQSMRIRSLREMFEMISLEMQNYGFYFSPQKCENKWRVLERKYKNLIFRERLKKPGRMRHYGHWEHKRALDEIFNEKERHVYMEENDFPSPTETIKYSMIVSRATSEQTTSSSNSNNNEHCDPLATLVSDAVPEKHSEHLECKITLTTLFQRFLDEMEKNFALAERNKERRHQEEMTMRQNELEMKKRLLKLKEQKIELQKCQMIAAAQHFHLNKQ
ncbi:PREDICTED: uncharacterized protein LOC106791356 [Polistes canadensis]|uniref:uncharacterized protein LOC106791356 n=1 Tax=Polistes canadensis TaxID=91411 RepID=UPI000718B405|nr:PREDICTED: uncharacterized protein LOC106791356 [Polistes canadensis]XP_014612419.1 PREDICTED: uncharacterized protein LOC106791356 [Polistes canadensis]KAI4480531.1 hypothetical protein M0804_010084 [Polistes exclamans]